ncbi:MAG: four-carbon acid sugar kinase family protein [Eubacteriales bacterium]|nr:four-carbon acid sugar kinase family protein [Eubacteriales bacterium]
MVRLLIIADDFTGALDTGIQFKKRGICTQVFTKQMLEAEDINPETEVLVVDTETRPAAKETAYEVVSSIARWALVRGIEIIFKKTDSALRGNIGAELQAVADVGGALYLLPGYPEIDRITKDGIHYISGELLENSVFGNDPFEPVKKSYIPDIIGEQSDISVTCVKNDEPIPECSGKKTEIVVCDTVKNYDIETRLDELVGKKRLKLIAGCAALGDCLVDKLSFHSRNEAQFRRTEGMYVACGSLNRITQKQVEYAETNCGFERKHLTMEQKLVPGYYETPEGKQFLDEIVELCRTKKKVVVDTFDVDGDKSGFLKDHGIPDGQVRELIAAAHGRIVNEIVSRREDVTVLMTGGDTLMGYMKQIGCTEIEPLCEIEQGVVVSSIECGGHRQQVISKSGGFGTEDILCRIAKKVINKH